MRDRLAVLASSISSRRTISGRSIISRRGAWPLAIDLALFGVVLASFYAIMALARYWWGAAIPEVAISRSPWALPAYAFYSVVRLFVAYGLSLAFAVGYGYIAAHHTRAERVMIPLLDILQSIPVLSFLPGVMLAMMSIFPTRQMGIEFGSILLIFTGQVWNMAFSFYSSLKSIPRELDEAASVYAFGRWHRFFRLEFPFGVIGLIWNSMVSMAGGWFFLMACEMFVLGKRDFRLPGLGSYLQTAANAGDAGAICWGLAAMIFVIVAIDQLLWRPLIAWSDKFKFEQVESDVPRSPVLDLLRKSKLLHAGSQRIQPAIEKLNLRFATRGPLPQRSAQLKRSGAIWLILIAVCISVAAFYGILEAVRLLAGVGRQDWTTTLASAAVTFLRVNLALVLASLWTIPAGVAIGFQPRLARIAQPLAQIAASVPATALFPIILLALIQVGGGLGIASILLMLLGTQWYILFNVIAGAIAIPSELREVSRVFSFGSLLRWRVVILPGIFPYLVTGLITASGGAWNASIIAEYFHLKGKVFTTFGLGAQISTASDAGRFDLLLLSTIVMAAMVVAVNRLVWRPLYRLAESRYRLEG